MSGHSKWNNIKRKKGAADAERGKVFTKIGREIQVAVKNGGPDPAINGRLKDIIDKAKANNMPNDNIQRSIKKAAGDANSENYEDITYEGYGVGGVAVMVRTLTDNRNRTAGDVRHTFDKFGGNMGTTGCVSFMFEDKGCLIIDGEELEDEDQLMLDAVEAGAEDLKAEDGAFVIYTSVDDFAAVRAALTAKGYDLAEADIEPIPNTYVSLEDPEQQNQLSRMIDMLEDNDDVQDVYHNCSNV
ncbi:MAG: YebC/PmpR family DNA-binding transcriptional regulator [Oscillospiraceae bacterium]|nr:YebC/PmpR family DNA-binding transcriptional regulator [Oscillospiraceae bacterium]MDD4368520.1 YebC/PmpR family DNA-binding transcriptional regulator [Oscillospiraceae bacterium]